ncbi:MAG TPA: hypothetical protein VEV84_16395, partial [Pyrinomonadaceae bacterium]|nr:hypothetical protein [Pyrinomonadaceae bacterium]
MPRKPAIAVIGAGCETEPAVLNARELGRLIAENGWVLISGGRDAGVMKAANEGAKSAKENLTINSTGRNATVRERANESKSAIDCLTIGILPNRDAEISPAVDVAIVTETGEARNNIIVLSANVVIACGVEGAGTASEVALALKNGKPVILLGANSAAREFFVGIGGEQIHIAESPEQAVRIVQDF